jgi:phage shock protein PspC (stress-responsive transcriptional regulator)
MNCAQCGTSIEPDSTFCRACGSRQAAAGPSRHRKLFRRTESGRIAGVCSGIAEYLDVDVTMVRVVWVVLSIVPGGLIGGVLAYLAAWIVMPEATGPAQIDAPARRLTRSLDDRKLAGVCGGIAEYLQIDSTIARLAWIVLTVIPGAIVFGVTAYLIAWFIMPEGQRAAVTPATAAPSAA